jgi:lipoprotein-anchoring transpeptidase ErfK/SrfK
MVRCGLASERTALCRHILRISFVAAAALVISALAAAADVLIAINKSAQRMTVAVDGALRWTWPVSTGRGGYETPSGSYTAFRMEKEHFSKEWDDAPMPNSIFFTKRGHAIHGSYQTNRLGRAVSHGCVRLHPANAAKLYALVESRGVTTAKVVVTGRDD